MNNNQLSAEYKEHQVFEVLKDIRDLYEFISQNSFGFLPTGLPEEWINIDTYISSSMRGTIDAMALLLGDAFINDAFALLRKYFDEVMVSIFYSVYSEDQIDKNSDKFLYTVEKLKRWTHGKEPSPRYYDTLKYLKRSNRFEALLEMFNFDGENGYKTIRDFLDDNMHLNSYRMFINNDNEIVNESRVKLLSLYSNYLKSIFLFHYTSVIYLKPLYIMSTDYRDCMDCGKTPPESSQYWVAPIADKMFVKYIKPKKDIAIFLKDCTDMEFSF